jgi:hypothetical protein
MATITMVHPINTLENEYESVSGGSYSGFLDGMNKNVIKHIKSLPLYSRYLGDFERTVIGGGSGNYQYMYIASYIDAPELKLRFGDTRGGYSDSGLLFMYEIEGPNTYYRGRSANELYHYAYNRVSDIYWYNVQKFQMALYNGANTNGFWLNDNNPYSINRFILTKCTNINDPTNVKYLPCSFTFRKGMQSARATYTEIPQEASLWRIQANLNFGHNEMYKTNNMREYQNESSGVYRLRPLIYNEWKYEDIFIIEGGIAPVYNVINSKIRIGNDEYLYLTDSLLLKVY